MKKHLFATSAIVAAGVALTMAPQNAAAQDDGGISLDVGGYYDFYYTFSEQDEPTGQNDFRTDRVRQEGEIEFAGSTELDNGITVGINVQLEAYSRDGSPTQGDQIDEHYAFVEGSFGRFEIGAHNSAPYLMHYIAPSVGNVNVNSPDFVPFQQQTNLQSFPTTFAVQSSDANKLTYFTPRLAGFQVGASYAPDTVDVNGQAQGTGLVVDDTGQGGRAYGIGANFVRSFGGFDVALSGGYELVEDDAPGGSADDNEQFMTGLNVGYAGFTVGGSYRNEEDDNLDVDVFDVGVSYSTGPWGASVTWLHHEVESNTDEADIDYALGSLTYALGPGITANAGIHYYNEDASDVNYDGDGFAGSLGLNLSF